MEPHSYPEEIAGIEDDTARSLEAVARLHSLAVERFYDRRNLEWRVSFTLWAGLVLAANALTDVELATSEKRIVGIGLLLIVIAHGAWEWMAIRPAAKADRKEGYSLALLQRNMLGLPPGEKMTREGKPKKEIPLIAQGWQVVITAVLSIFVAVVAL